MEIIIQKDYQFIFCFYSLLERIVYFKGLYEFFSSDPLSRELNLQFQYFKNIGNSRKYLPKMTPEI